MSRKPQKSTEDIIWKKATKIEGKNPKEYRLDAYGNKIQRSKYGKQINGGYHHDHIIPKSRGGTDHIDNLEPLAWKENVSKSNTLKKKGVKKAKQNPKTHTKILPKK